MKVCSKCKIEKPFELFSKCSGSKSGLQPKCKECNRVYRIENKYKIYLKDKKYREKNKEKIVKKRLEYYIASRDEILQKHREYYIDNRERILEKCKEYRDSNKDKITEYKRNNLERTKEYNRLYYLLNTDLHFAKAAKYRASKLCATPKWLTEEHYAQIVDIYKEREILTEITGILYHVDHIVPLQGETVCGLHVPWNLQVIPATENLSKSNKLMEELLEELFLQQKGEVENHVKNSSEDHL